MSVRLLTSAVQDLESGREFYERQGSGLGDYFIDSLFSDIESLNLYAGVHRKVFGFYRLLANRFPYAVYYKLENKIIIVYRVLDLRQDPDKTRKSLI